MKQIIRSIGVAWNFWVLLALCLFFALSLAKHSHAALLSRNKPRAARIIKAAPDRCLVKLDNRSVANVAIAVDGTVLDFPLKPNKVILGRKGSFGIEYVESDLAISPLSLSSRSHLYVYLQDRRFTFNLSTTAAGGCAVITVRDAIDNQVSVDGIFRSR